VSDDADFDRLLVVCLSMDALVDLALSDFAGFSADFFSVLFFFSAGCFLGLLLDGDFLLVEDLFSFVALGLAFLSRFFPAGSIFFILVPKKICTIQETKFHANHD